MKPLVIYHANCWDGFCAAWIARNALRDVDTHPAHYGTELPDVAGRDVYVLDFSYKRDVMRRLLGLARRVVVLDHHATAKAELDGLADEFIQRPDLIATPPGGAELPTIWVADDKSGGRMAWEYFNHPPLFSAAADVPSPSPWLVDYTEDRDLWRHALSDSQEINAALRSYPLDFDLWDEFAQGKVDTLVTEGRAIRRREKQIICDHTRNAREVQIASYCVRAVNATVLFSEIAGELAQGRPFGACYFDRQDGKRQWSLRSDPNGVDVGAIAKSLGGGGHKHAAGYETT